MLNLFRCYLYIDVFVAVWGNYLQGVRDHQGHIDWRDRVHVDRPERRPVLRHRGPDAQASRVDRRPQGHQVHRHGGHRDLVFGYRLRRTISRLLVHPQVRYPERDHRPRLFHGDMLPVPRNPGELLSEVRRPGQVPDILRNTVVRHRVFLHHDGQTPDKEHQEHARRSPSQYYTFSYTGFLSSYYYNDLKIL